MICCELHLGKRTLFHLTFNLIKDEDYSPGKKKAKRKVKAQGNIHGNQYKCGLLMIKGYSLININY